LSQHTRFEDLRRVTVVGAGTMGAGMSMCFAQAGYEVCLYSRTSESLDRALARIESSQALFVQEGLISAVEAEAAQGRITTTTRLEECLEETQFVLESVPEDLALKQALFQRIEAACPARTILATNTSGLSITAIASACARPELVGGMHWANPPEIVPLVEVVRGEQTSDNTVDVIYRATEKLGKAPVLIQRELPGFASNRLQYAVLREALYLVAEGVVSAEDVDRTLKNGIGFRYPWLGPLETADLGGLDVFHNVGQYLFPALNSEAEMPEVFRQLVAEGKYGIKSGEGFFEYEPDAREEILRKRDLFFVRQLKAIREIKTQ
jgi:3-hydroxybutyryl-CoA dehydrogenase